jgi:exopolyphosphatase/guanosine-5'-triphosphate,3'-diphosphate pyrophosphatase
MDKIAIIDMGTNTFHLLIAEKDVTGYRIVRRDQEVVKIGMGGINEGFIPEAACERAVTTMKKFKSTIVTEKVESVFAFGTSAMRSASNGPSLASDIEAATGIAVEIISGEKEADLIFEGVKTALDFGSQKALVLDIGAGSVECIIGDNQSTYWKRSFEIGGQRLLERFQKHDPIAQEEIKALDTFFEKSLGPLQEALAKFNPTLLAGSSGTFDTLSEIYCLRHHIPMVRNQPETPLTHAGFFDIYQELIRKNRSERMQIPGMIAMRVDMIVVACCLIRYILEKHPFEQIRVSFFSLKEGALAKLAGAH